MNRLLFVLLLLVAGCAPGIGDACETSTDCSQNGDRLCDVSQPGGYCTVFACDPGSCPDDAVCILFGKDPSTVAGCEDDTGSNPSARSFCMKKCKNSGDCRQPEGYICVDPVGPDRPISAVNLDAPSKVCMFVSSETRATDAASDVCHAEPVSSGGGGEGGGG